MAHTPNKPLRTQFVYRRCHPGDYQALRFLVRESWPVDMRNPGPSTCAIRSTTF